MKNLHALRALTSQRMENAPCAKQIGLEICLPIVVNVQFRAHNFSLKKIRAHRLCVYANESYFTRFNLEKVFDLIEFVNQKLHRKECVCWCAARYEVNQPNPFHAKNEIQFNYTRSASSTCTESQCSLHRSQSTNYRCTHSAARTPHSWKIWLWFFNCTICWLAAVVYERTIVFSGQTSGSTDFSINSSRCAQPPALPNNHQYFSLTFCWLANGNDLCVAFVRSPSHSVCLPALLVFDAHNNLPHSRSRSPPSWMFLVLIECTRFGAVYLDSANTHRLFMLLSVALNYFSTSTNKSRINAYLILTYRTVSRYCFRLFNRVQYLIIELMWFHAEMDRLGMEWNAKKMVRSQIHRKHSGWWWWCTLHRHNTHTISTIAMKSKAKQFTQNASEMCPNRDRSTVGRFDRHLKFKWVFKSQTGIALQRNWIQSELSEQCALRSVRYAYKLNAIIKFCYKYN